MSGAWIGEEQTTVEAALLAAARQLTSSRLAVIAGLSTDVAGARAAVALAEQIGGIVDHMHSAALLRDLDAMREGGLMLTTPGEAYNRADLLLLVGPEMQDAELVERLLDGHSRRSVWLCTGREFERRGAERLGSGPDDLPNVVAALRAVVAGRPIGTTAVPREQIEHAAALLKAAKFGVAVWSGSGMDDLTLAMLCGLVKDMNDTTRFSGLPLPQADNGLGVQQVIAWRSGFPVRTGFGRGFAEHDPWRFDAVRLVDNGEADCALWIAAGSGTMPPWSRPVPLIALAGETMPLRRGNAIVIEVGRPGIDHASVTYSALLGGLAAIDASHPSDALSVREALDGIAARLQLAGAC